MTKYIKLRNITQDYTKRTATRKRSNPWNTRVHTEIRILYLTQNVSWPRHKDEQSGLEESRLHCNYILNEICGIFLRYAIHLIIDNAVGVPSVRYCKCNYHLYNVNQQNAFCQCFNSILLVFYVSKICCSSSGRLYCTGVLISMFIIRKTILYRGADKYVHHQEDYIVQGCR